MRRDPEQCNRGVIRVVSSLERLGPRRVLSGAQQLADQGVLEFLQHDVNGRTSYIQELARFA